MIERAATNGEQRIERLQRVRPEIPQQSIGFRIARRARIGIAHVAESGLRDVGAQLRERCCLLIRRKLRIRMRDEKIVPRADADAVRMIEADRTVRVELHKRVRIVHDRAVAEPTRREIVREPERMADLVRRELAQARERHLLRLVGELACVRLVVGREQRLGDQDVLTHALRAQRHRALDDLAGARIDDRLPVRPAARVAMRPRDDAVADVHRIRAFGQQLDAVRILEACFLECGLPPVRAFEQRRAHRFRRAAIEVEHDRLLHRALRRGRIGLVEPESRLVTHVEARRERLRVVVEADAESTRRRMIKTRRESRRRQAHETQMLAHRQALGLHRDVLDELLVARALERQHRFELGVVRKALRVLGRYRAPLVVDLVFALLRIGKTFGDAVQVRRQQRADVNDELGIVALALAGDVAGPEHRFGERLAHALRFLGVGRDRAELRVVFDQQQARARATELDEMRFAALAAIEADVVRAEAPRQRRDEQERACRARARRARRGLWRRRGRRRRSRRRARCHGSRSRRRRAPSIRSRPALRRTPAWIRAQARKGGPRGSWASSWLVPERRSRRVCPKRRGPPAGNHARCRATRLAATPAKTRHRLQIRGDVVDCRRRQAVRDDFHDRAFGPLVGALEHGELLDEIVGVLAGEPRIRVVAQRLGSVAARCTAGTPLVGHAAGEDRAARLDARGRTLDGCGTQRLRREVLGELVDLPVASACG